GYLRALSDEAADRDDAGGDDDDEHGERAHDDGYLAADGGDRRRPARLIDRDAPSGKAVAERHRGDELGSLERPLAVHGPAGRVHDRVDRRRFGAREERFEDLAAQAVRAPRHSDQQWSTAVAEDGAENRGLADGDLAPATAITLNDLRAERRNHRRVASALHARVDDASFTVEHVETLRDGCRGDEIVEGPLHRAAAGQRGLQPDQRVIL